jgi:hypothetical protein
MKRLLIIVFATGIQFAMAQLPVLKTSVDKRHILIGEQIKYNVEASFTSGAWYISWLNVPDSFSHFEVVIRGKIDTVDNNGKTILRQTLTLTSFDSGVYAIPQLPVNFDPVNHDTTLSLFTDSIPVNISFSPLDSTKTFHDIKTIIEVKDVIPWWVWAGGAFLLLLLIVGIIYLIRYLRRKKPLPIFNSKLSPFDEAMQSLGSLQNEQLLSKGESKEYHSRLTDIFKRYLSRKMQKNILNLTSTEILMMLNDTLLSKTDTAVLAGNLRMTDAVKFAKYMPPKLESEAAWLSTRKIIEQIEKLIFTDTKEGTN